VGLIAGRAATLLAGPGAGLLLDLDGTLVDSESVHAAAYREYFRGRGWQVEDAVIGKFAGRRAADVFATLAGPWSGEDPVLLTEGVLETLAATTTAYTPVAGAAQLVRACARAGLPVAVVTSAGREWVGTVLDLLGVGDMAMPMVTGQDCTRGKPDPQPFLRGADLLGRRPEDLVAAEDSTAGIACARRAGIGHVLAISTSGSAGGLLAAGAHDTAPDLVALAGVVDQLAGARAEVCQ
jgi:sugar-phosphatase